MGSTLLCRLFWGLANFYIGGLEYWWHSCAPTNATRSTSSCLVLRTCRLYRANPPSYPASRQRPTTRGQRLRTPQKGPYPHQRGGSDHGTLLAWPGYPPSASPSRIDPHSFRLRGWSGRVNTLTRKKRLGLHLGRPWEQCINVRKHKGTHRPR